MRQEASLNEIPALAAYLGIDESLVWDAIDRGLLPIVPPHSKHLIHEADLQAAVEAGVFPAPRRRSVLALFRGLRRISI